MSAKITGQCLCGHIKYTYTGPLGPAGYCHCEDCRRCGGSAFGISVRLDRDQFEISTSHVKGFIKRGASGTELTRHFCPECGSPIYTSSPRHPLHVYVKAGTLDDPAVVKPGHQSWVSSAVPWSAIDSSLPTFPRGRV